MHGIDRIIDALFSRQIVAVLVDGNDVLERGSRRQANQPKQLIEPAVEPASSR
jgi:hypothetical protein